MRSPATRPTRPINRIDVTASLLAKVTPAPLTPAIDQARRDLRALVDGWLGQNEKSFRTVEEPARPPRALEDIDPVEEVLPRGLRGSYAAMKRDVKVVVSGLRGQHPPPLIARKAKTQEPRAKILAQAPATSVRRMRISAVTRETPDAITIELEDSSRQAVVYEPGQFMSLRVDVNGETLWRAYSINTAPSSSALPSVTIKRVPDGRVSNYLNDHAAVGQMLDVRGPSGRFTLKQSATSRHIVLIGGGSGITPLLSHARHWLSTEAHTRVTLLYGNRGVEDIIFLDVLSSLAQQYRGRFVVRHVLEKPAPSFACGVGRLDQATCERELADLHVIDDATTEYLVCGPEPMMDAVHGALVARGIGLSRIHEERFSQKPQSSSLAAFKEQLVTLNVKGKDTEVRVGAGQTILDAATSAQVPLDFSCTMGGCGACMAHLVDGTVSMEEPNCLTESEKKAGMILTCIAHPTSGCRVEKK